MKTAFTEGFKTRADRQVNMRLAANMLGVGRAADAVELRGLYPWCDPHRRQRGAGAPWSPLGQALRVFK
jgi:hypothetical protein